MTDPKQSAVRDELADIIGLETDPEGQPYYLLTFNANGDLLEGVDYSGEVKELEALMLRHTAEVLERILKLEQIEWVNRGDVSSHEQFVHANAIRYELSAIKEQL